MACINAVTWLVVIVFFASRPCSSNIHRAVKSKQTAAAAAAAASSSDTNDQVMDPLQQVKDNQTYSAEFKFYQAQTFSIIASLAIGCTGILPLLVIPLEAGPKLKHGPGARKLRLLLSFAVGGLLGDVFLHLLPESWKHLSSNDEAAHRTMGFWVLAGIFAFIIIEMIFANSDTVSTQPDKVMNGKICKEENDNYISYSDNSLRHRKENGTLKNSSNGNASNGHPNGTIHHNGVANGNLANKCEISHHIDIAGYLNLFANMMDNFTHGLAISASFLNSTRVGVLTTFAILIHEVPHEVGDFAILLKSGFDRWGAAKAQIFTAFFGLCGALTALCVESPEDIGTKTAFLLPFTAGGFIQIALVNVLPDLLKESNSREAIYQVICITAGIASMAAVTFMTE